MYEYLIGVFICGIVWLILFLMRRDLRKPMLWTAAVYFLFNSFLLTLWHILRKFFYLGDVLIPNYWNPPMIFGLGLKTGFGGIEDFLFIFFIAGIATCIYEHSFKEKIKFKKSYKPHIKAFFACLISFFLFAHFLPWNLLYSFIFSYIVGTIVLCFERKDLVKHSLLGGFAFLIIYVLIFVLFNLLFPNFINQYYNLGNLSGIIWLKIPLEEFLFAFCFGTMWAPIYEYEHGEKDVSSKK